MEDVGLRGIKRLGRVAQVLGARKGSEGKQVQIESLRENSAHRFDFPIGLVDQILPDVFLLRDLVFHEQLVPLNIKEVFDELITAIFLNHRFQFPEHSPPHFLLLISVLGVWNGRVHFIVETGVGDFVSPLQVLLICLPRMVLAGKELDVHGEVVEIVEGNGEIGDDLGTQLFDGGVVQFHDGGNFIDRDLAVVALVGNVEETFLALI